MIGTLPVVQTRFHPKNRLRFMRDVLFLHATKPTLPLLSGRSLEPPPLTVR